MVDNNKETEFVVADAINAIKEGMKKHDITECLHCFNCLTDVLERIDKNPNDERYYLENWLRTFHLSRIVNSCHWCHPPHLDRQSSLVMPQKTDI